MIKKNNRIRCDECGCFVAYKDLDDGTAIHTMVLPDSDYSCETWESICKKCNKEDDYAIYGIDT